MIKTLLKILGIKNKRKSNIERFLNEDITVVTARDVDPEGSRLYDNYSQAMAYKEKGEFEKAATLLEQSCIEPSIYKGHYRELFKIYRQWNKIHVKKAQYSVVSDRVLKMIRYDEEMIKCMLKHWSKVQKQSLPKDYFDKDRNFKISDAKALLKAAENLNDKDNIKLAQNWMIYFEQKKAKK